MRSLPLFPMPGTDITGGHEVFSEQVGTKIFWRRRAMGILIQGGHLGIFIQGGHLGIFIQGGHLGILIQGGPWVFSYKVGTRYSQNAWAF